MKPSSTSARLAELNFLEENLWRSCVFLNVSLEIVCHREHEIARITLEYSSLDSLVRNMAFGVTSVLCSENVAIGKLFY